jgi:hypothetical protein
MGVGDDSPRLQGGGARRMTLVCRPTPFVRFMHRSEHCSKQLLSRMARLHNSVVFLPTALRRGTRRNAIRLKTCKRTPQVFFYMRAKAEISSPPVGGAPFIPSVRPPGAFRRGYGKTHFLTTNTSSLSKIRRFISLCCTPAISSRK